MWAKWIFGPRTEKRAHEPSIVAGQSWLPFADLLDAAQRIADPHSAQGTLSIEPPKQTASKPRGKRRNEFPDHLPRVRTTIEVPEAARICCKRPND